MPGDDRFKGGFSSVTRGGLANRTRSSASLANLACCSQTWQSGRDRDATPGWTNRHRLRPLVSRLLYQGNARSGGRSYRFFPDNAIFRNEHRKPYCSTWTKQSMAFTVIERLIPRAGRRAAPSEEKSQTAMQDFARGLCAYVLMGENLLILSLTLMTYRTRSASILYAAPTIIPVPRAGNLFQPVHRGVRGRDRRSLAARAQSPRP